MTRRATAIAHANIALVKYWGKREGVDPTLNLPAVGSLSITLSGLTTRTTVEFRDDLERDEIGGDADPERASAFLDLVRAEVGVATRARVESGNDFPTGAGLASSASGFAALTLAATKAAGADLDETALSRLARQGSGSAARSIFGGFAEWERGEREDGLDSFARQLWPCDHWPLHVVVAITSSRKKAVGSREGMLRTAKTSPLYRRWIETQLHDLVTTREAIRARDFERLAKVVEDNCLKMHASMATANPSIVYFTDATFSAMETVRDLRDKGVPVCFTIDAGPQVKAVCEAEVVDRVRDELIATEGVERVIVSALGEGARLVDDAG